jgi:putative Mg2+ transporter-C (MgtC) family protein
VAIDPQDLLKIGLGILIGALVGAEREYRDKSAGFRTMIFICLGSTLFTMHSISIGVTRDQARIAAAVVSGVGFLGGGAILRGGMNIKGLTTAATIWLTAALGMGVGAGYFGLILPAAGAVLVVLWFFPIIEHWIDDLKTSRMYEVVCPASDDPTNEIQAIFKAEGLKVFPKSRHKHGEKLTCVWYVTGKPAGHDIAVTKLLSRANVEDLTY